MRRVHIVGKKNHGKTTLTVALVSELTRRGFAVGTIKHSPHSHELDTPGKDSHRHRCAGASPASVVTADLVGVFLPRSDAEDPYARLAPIYEGCDLVLVEGDKGLRGGLKVEVWRAEVGGAPLCAGAGRDDIAALVTDDAVEVAVPVWPRGDVSDLTDRVLALCGLDPQRSQG